MLDLSLRFCEDYGFNMHRQFERDACFLKSTMADLHPPHLRFSAEDLARIPAETFVDRVDYHDELSSTNGRANELGSVVLEDCRSVLVLADRQTAGRGRGANRWWSADGALTCSVLFRTFDCQVPACRWPQMSLTTGLAVCEAIESTLPSVVALLKWPNDVYVGGRKVGGILVEAAHGARTDLVVGIGVNVNNSIGAAPAELRDRAVALCDVVGGQVSRIDLSIALLQQLAARIQWLGAGGDDLQEAWSRRCLLTGRAVEIEMPSRRIAGVCRGIDRDGALVVDTEAGSERCLSGVVARFC